MLTGRCLDSTAALPYLPFTEVVGQLVAGRPEQLTAHPELQRLLPGRPPGETGREDREMGQLRVFDAMLSALDTLTAGLSVRFRPLLSDDQVIIGFGPA